MNATHIRWALLITSGLMFGPRASAQLFSENFDNVGGLIGAGWATQNNSTSPYLGYFQGEPDVFSAHQGAASSYMGVNFQSTNDPGSIANISNWMITPVIANIQNGVQFSFFSRKADNSNFPDRLEVRLNTANTGTDVGTTFTSVGDFTNLVGTINPDLTTTGYPDSWTQFTFTVTGVDASTSGRFAFRYFVPDGGPAGANSDFIGIDTLIIAVPEPGCVILAGAMAGGIALRLRRRGTSHPNVSITGC